MLYANVNLEHFTYEIIYDIDCEKSLVANVVPEVCVVKSSSRPRLKSIELPVAVSVQVAGSQPNDVPVENIH